MTDPKQIVAEAVASGQIAPPEKTPPPPKFGTPLVISLSEAKRIERKYWLRGGVTKRGNPLYIVSPK